MQGCHGLELFERFFFCWQWLVIFTQSGQPHYVTHTMYSSLLGFSNVRTSPCCFWDHCCTWAHLQLVAISLSLPQLLCASPLPGRGVGAAKGEVAGSTLANRVVRRTGSLEPCPHMLTLTSWHTYTMYDWCPSLPCSPCKFDSAPFFGSTKHPHT